MNLIIPTEVYSRVCGYYRPVKQWNKAKQAEFSDRLPYSVQQAIDKKIGIED